MTENPVWVEIWRDLVKDMEKRKGVGANGGE